MTIFIFISSLLAAMALGVPIAFSLLICGVALMWHMNIFDAQILALNVIEGANSFPLLAVPFFMLAGELMMLGVPLPPVESEEFAQSYQMVKAIWTRDAIAAERARVADIISQNDLLAIHETTRDWLLRLINEGTK